MTVDSIKTAHSNDNDHFIKRSFNSYLIPSILAILGGNISIMVDNCVAGAALGEQELAAMGIVNPVFNLITAFGLLICGGASALTSISIGQGDTEKKNRYFTLTLYMLIFIAAIVTLSGNIFIDPIVKLLGAEGELIPLAKDYSRMLFFSSIALMGVYFPLNFLRVEGKAKISMIMFFIMAGLDIILDFVFVLVFPWGMMGLALATGLSSFIAVLCVMPSLFSPKMGYRIVRVKNILPDVGKIILTGSPLALNNLYCVVRVRIFNALLISCGGSLALAAYSCANSVNNIGMAVVSGVAQTVGPIVGVLYGERDKEGIHCTVSLSVKIGCMVTACMWIVAVVFSRQLAMLFGMTSPEQNQTAALAISILNFNLIFSLIVNVFIYYYMTTGRAGISNLITVLKAIIFNVALSFAGTKLFGFNGFFVGLALSEVFCVLTAYISASVKKKRESCENILLLPSKLFDNAEYLSKTISATSEEISETAEAAGDFCAEHGLTPKQSMTVSLGIEEIMVLMAQIALAGTEESIEFRLFITENETILRIRCAGKHFDPLSYEPEDELENLGVKMLLKMASDVSYSTNLGLNNIKLMLSGESSQKEGGK